MMIITTTCATKREAERIARALLRERLVACVNMWPVHSVYRWKSKIEQANEWILVCKTRKGLGTKVELIIRELHTYKLPVIERWEVKRMSDDVEKWVTIATR